MAGNAVRLLDEQDTPIAYRLSCEAGWNQTEDDWRMLLRLSPENCFGIDADGRLVATATLICYGKQLAWIGMVLTNRAYQRRGFARTLLQRTIDRADELGIESLKLDATDQGQPLYEKLGFRVEQPVERWWRGATGAPIEATLWLHDTVKLDQAAFGADRSQLLSALGERGKFYARPGGFCLCRAGRRANYVGPCISQSREIAREFIGACASEESYWDLLPHNHAALELAQELGFSPQRKLIRMVRGRDLRGREDWIYAIAGFELG